MGSSVFDCNYLSQAADTVESQRPESPLTLAVTIKDELGNIDLKSIISGETSEFIVQNRPKIGADLFLTP